MGRLIEGKWTTDDATKTDARGRWQRSESRFRELECAPEPGRYHLIVAINCPWAHRAMIVRLVKQLEDLVSIEYVLPRRTDQGWVFEDGRPLHEVYTQTAADCTGRVTVPTLVDRKRNTIVNNESSEIIQMFNRDFAKVAPPTPDLYPQALRPEIDQINERVYRTINNGVYQCGFARSQEAYDEAFDEMFDTLEMLDGRLATCRYLVGDRHTLADWRLFPTLVRFDTAYYGAFKCNKFRIQDAPNLSRYLRDLCATPGVADTVDLDIYRRGYYSKSENRNPYGVIPMAPRVPL